VEVFFALADVRDKLERWRQDYNQVRSHSALKYLQYFARCGLSRLGRNWFRTGRAVSAHCAANSAGALSRRVC
jgi:hypothetical protein